MFNEVLIAKWADEKIWNLSQRTGLHILINIQDENRETPLRHFNPVLSVRQWMAKLEPADSVRQEVPKAGDRVGGWEKLLESSLRLQSMNTSLKAGIGSRESLVSLKSRNQGTWKKAPNLVACLRACSVMSDSLDSMDCNPPGSSVHGIFQAILEWGAISFSRRSSRPRSPAL